MKGKLHAQMAAPQRRGPLSQDDKVEWRAASFQTAKRHKDAEIAELRNKVQVLQAKTFQLIQLTPNRDRSVKYGATSIGQASQKPGKQEANDHESSRTEERADFNKPTAKPQSSLYGNTTTKTPLVGKRVVINGLVAKRELNGCTGTAVRFDNAEGRYSVELDVSHDESSSSFMIKPCNLEIFLPTASAAQLQAADDGNAEQFPSEVAPTASAGPTATGANGSESGVHLTSVDTKVNQIIAHMHLDENSALQCHLEYLQDVNGALAAAAAAKDIVIARQSADIAAAAEAVMAKDIVISRQSAEIAQAAEAAAAKDQVITRQNAEIAQV